MVGVAMVAAAMVVVDMVPLEAMAAVVVTVAAVRPYSNTTNIRFAAPCSYMSSLLLPCLTLCSLSSEISFLSGQRSPCLQH